MTALSPSVTRGWTWRRALSVTILTIATLYLILVAAKGIEATFDQEEFPDALAIKMEMLPIIFPVHMLTGGLALLLVPITYALRRKPAHRWVGSITATLVLISGITAIPVALAEPVTPWSGAGFMTQALLWLTFLSLGLYYLWKKKYRAHRYFMLLMAAVTSGAVFFRLWLALWAMMGSFRHYHLVYSIDSWVGWLLPLTFAIVVLKRPKLL